MKNPRTPWETSGPKRSSDEERAAKKKRRQETGNENSVDVKLFKAEVHKERVSPSGFMTQHEAKFPYARQNSKEPATNIVD